jgi:hypothetical protein
MLLGPPELLPDGLLDGHAASFVDQGMKRAFVQLRSQRVADGLLTVGFLLVLRSTGLPVEFERGAEDPCGSFGLLALGEGPSELQCRRHWSSPEPDRECLLESLLGELGGVRVAVLEVRYVGEVLPRDDASMRVQFGGQGQSFLEQLPRSIEFALVHIGGGEIPQRTWQPALEVVLTHKRKRLFQEGTSARHTAGTRGRSRLTGHFPHHAPNVAACLRQLARLRQHQRLKRQGVLGHSLARKIEPPVGLAQATLLAPQPGQRRREASDGLAFPGLLGPLKRGAEVLALDPERDVHARLGVRVEAVRVELLDKPLRTPRRT